MARMAHELGSDYSIDVGSDGMVILRVDITYFEAKTTESAFKALVNDHIDYYKEEMPEVCAEIRKDADNLVWS